MVKAICIPVNSMARGADVPVEDLARLQSANEHPDVLSDITYTSGAMGVPKGDLLTHDLLLRCAFSSALSRAFEVGPREHLIALSRAPTSGGIRVTAPPG